MKVENPSLLRELASLNSGGRRAFRTEQIQRFSEFPERFQRRFSVFGIPDAVSAAVIQERLTDPIVQIASAHGIEFLLAGRDIGLHTTLQEGEYPEGDKEKMQSDFTDLTTDLSAQDLIGTLAGTELVYKYLLVGQSKSGQETQSNVTVAADVIPEQIVEVRRNLVKKYEAIGMRHLPIKIVHMTLGRIVELPDRLDPATRESYIRELINLRHTLAKDPVQVTIGDVYIGPSWDFITKKPVS